MLRFRSRRGPAFVCALFSAVFLLSGCTQEMKRLLSKNFSSPTPVVEKGKDTRTPTKRPAYQICTACLLIDKDGKAIHGAGDSVRGALEKIIVLEDKAQFVGWAADVEIGKSVKVILIFADDELVHSGVAEDRRYDVAMELKQGGLARFGFSIVLPKNLFVSGDGKQRVIRVFAVSASDTATELPFLKKQ